MEPESPAPKKRVHKRKAAPVSEEILNVVEDLESASAPKTKRVYKRKTTAKQSVSAQPTTISVQHNTHTDSLRPAMTSGRAQQDDPFAILDKDLEFKDFFEKYEQKQVQPVRQVVTNRPAEPKSAASVRRSEDVDFINVQRNNTLKNFDDVGEEKEVSGWGKKLLKWVGYGIVLVALGYVSYAYIYPYFTKVDYVKELGKVAVLPTNENPTVYRVTKEAELIKNPLFKGAISGDIVFFYEKNKLVYVYRESQEKMVSITSFDVPTPASTTTAEPATQTSATSTASTTPAISTTTKATSTSTKASTTVTTQKTTATTTKK